MEKLYTDKPDMGVMDKPKIRSRSLSCPPKIQTNITREVSQKLIRRSSTTSKLYSKINKHKEDIVIKVNLPKGQAAKKLEKAAPYNFYLTAVTDSPLTHHIQLTITFQDILDKSLGDLECSGQINFIVDVHWLFYHYYIAGYLNTPLLILYGNETPALIEISKHEPKVTATKIRMFSPFATHHTKMMLLGYKDGSMRVIISTANLNRYDWDNQTQGIWISPKLNTLPHNANSSDCESQTGFRNDLLIYLEEYKDRNLQPCSINVASIPGRFRKNKSNGYNYKWGHARLGKILKEHSAKIYENIPIIAQSSSIGSLERNEYTWIQHDLINSLQGNENSIRLHQSESPKFQIIYPSFNNLTNSHNGILAGGGRGLSYVRTTYDKQLWLNNNLYQWISKSRYRSKAMPHIKTYCRWSNEGLYWFVLTSANLSKVAWGTFDKNPKAKPSLRISNYEVGVVFLPRIIIGEATFPLNTKRDGIPDAL